MKKGQLALILIVISIIIIGVALFIVVRKNNEKSQLQQAIDSGTEVSTEFTSVSPFVTKCLKTISTQGLVIAGERGGYIYSDNLKITDKPTESEAVRLTKNSALAMPYWFYLSSSNGCEGQCDFNSKKLELKKGKKTDSVEAQLERYVKEHLNDCIQDFKALKDSGFQVEVTGQPIVKAEVAEEDIIFTLEYPFTVRGSEKEADFKDFYQRIDVNLKDVYSMAGYLADLEAEHRFLEQDILNLIVAFSDKDKKKLPPMSDSSFLTASNVRWQKSRVKSQVRSLLSSYIQFLRVDNTPNWREINTGSYLANGLYNSGMAIPNNISIYSLAVNFNYYDFWDIYFNLNCHGEVCEPESAFTNLLPIGLQRYNFAYDISFPVMVEINDPTALEDEGYSFYFMLESNIRNNEAMPSDWNPIIPQNDEETMLCDEEKRTSGNVAMSLKDSLSESPVDGVSVYYSCIDSCYIGDSSIGILNTSLPVCLGGILTFFKDGYETKYVRYNAAVDKSSDLNIELNPLKDTQIEIRKKFLTKDGSRWILSDREEGITDLETASITMQKITNDADSDFQMSEVTTNSSDKIKLTVGTYALSASLISEEGLYIPEQTKTVGIKQVKTPELNLSSVLIGQLTLNYTITPDDMKKDRLVVIIPTLDSMPTKAEDMDFNFENATRENSIKLVPRFE